jgi:hypothetical protein
VRHLGLRLTVCVLSGVLMSACLCSDKVVHEEISPDGVLTATWLVRDCGATTGLSTIVSVHRTSDTAKDAQQFVFVARGRYGLRLRWVSPRELSVSCGNCTRGDVFREVTVLGGVDVAFHLGAPPGQG